MAQIFKPLGLHQRIPMDILHEALMAVLDGGLDRERIRELVCTEYSGQNRQEKAFRQIMTTLAGNPLLEYCRKRKDEVLKALRSGQDRNLILWAVMVSRYPFCFDLTIALAVQSRLQDEICTGLILRMMGAKYGANKSVQNVQINALAQMLETRLVFRSRPGAYVLAEPLEPQFKITADLWIESYLVNEPLAGRDDVGSLMLEPYFRFLKVR